ncbi:putative amidohydrolase [Nakamurella sp. UYEF19]|uniref:carbon-nitrogen hydrolase family protein n=1 Tax=Nakamurella sp. UYEF19 TaxID=1756392 RepID=UPI0033960331
MQFVSSPGDISAAVAEHVRLIEAAAESGADVVLFPELSLTGYEPDLIDLHGLRIGPDDKMLQPISQICRQRRVHALIGGPTPGAGLPQIGVLQVDPRGAIRVVYAKQHLHVGEIGIFGAGTAGALLEIGGWKLALSVCSDAAVDAHPVAAAAAGADAYLVGALYVIGSEHRINQQMHEVTRQGMWAVLAQYSGGTGGGPACGLSGAWGPDGNEVVRLGAGPGIALVDLTD